MTKPDLNKLIKEYNIHSTFLNEEGIISALNKAYDLGEKNVLNWLSNQKHISDNIDYLIDEWKNQSH
jgi:hypothetical protein